MGVGGGGERGGGAGRFLDNSLRDVLAGLNEAAAWDR